MAAAPVVIAPIDNCLPNFIESGKVVDWKRYLFYMLGYCDTYHDFHGSRLGDSKQIGDRGDIVRLVKSIGPLSDYIKKVIGVIDSDFKWETNVYNVINTGMGGSKKFTFENAMFNTFTKTIATPSDPAGGPINLSPLAKNMTPQGFGEEYMKYLHKALKISQNQILDTQILTMKDFTDGVPEAYSSIVELEMPAILKTNPEIISKNLYIFIEKNYPMRIDKDGVSKIPFVEDTASFPRSIFQGYNSNIQAGAFLKIETPQTLWDPAGLSEYSVGGKQQHEKKSDIIAAPSFLAKQSYSGTGTNMFNNTSAYFNGATNKLVLPDYTFNLNNYSGPSVNHLVLHMILNTPGTITDTTIQNNLTTLIKASTIKKSGNYTFMVEDLTVSNNIKEQRLRNYTSSKRSGDYENIHSAMVHKAIMFTGDEPAFLYAVMNRCPIIYHIKSEIRHTFRFYIPPPPGDVAVAIEDTRKQLRDYVHDATELVTIFGTSVGNYKTMFEDVKNKVGETIKIIVTGNQTYGERLGTILKGALVKNIKGIEETIKHIVEFKNIENKLKVDSKDYITEINTKLKDLGKINEIDIDKEPGKEKFEILKEGVNEAVRIIKENIQYAETKLSSVRDLIPRKFKGSKTQDYQFFNLFEETARNQSCFSIGAESYKFGETKILPDLPKTFNMAFKKLAQIASNIERGGRRGGGYNFLADDIQAIKEILTELQCDEKVIELFKEGSEFPTTPNDIQTKYDFIKDIEGIVGLFAPVAGQAGGRVAVDRPINQYNLIQSKFNKTYKNSKIMQVRQNKTRRNKIYNQTIQTNILTKQIPEPSTRYETLYADILEQATLADIQPFGLTPEEYAASIVYRCILVDKLHSFFYPTGVPTSSPELSVANDPTPVMEGGVIIPDSAEANYVLYLLNDVLGPFWRKYLQTSQTNPDFIDQIYSDSFISDYIYVLEEIIGAPLDTFTDKSFIANVVLAQNNAKAAIEKLINLAKNNGTTERIMFTPKVTGATVGTSKNNVRKLLEKTHSSIASQTEDFSNINSVVLYFKDMFALYNGPFLTDDERNDALCAGPGPGPGTDRAKFIKAQQEYLHFYFKSYLDLMYGDKPAPAGVGGKFNNQEGVNGGARKTRRRARAIKQRKSKRRVPRRKRNNK